MKQAIVLRLSSEVTTTPHYFTYELNDGEKKLISVVVHKPNSTHTYTLKNESWIDGSTQESIDINDILQTLDTSEKVDQIYIAFEIKDDGFLWLDLAGGFLLTTSDYTSHTIQRKTYSDKPTHSSITNDIETQEDFNVELFLELTEEKIFQLSLVHRDVHRYLAGLQMASIFLEEFDLEKGCSVNIG
ncbi:Uncharacterised protein [Serratia quinivorans]|uniref:Uncharacterized protein n=1 Tax=Serratia quinivorans TaxID=137545 RepID=A0A380AGZ0_9GAMM|nr:Uncharacterised protein [Serratia quinivorans]